MSIDVRPTRPDEYRRAADAFTISLMVAPPSDEAWARSEPTWESSHSFSAWDGDQCVGHAAHFLLETTVPGGARLSTGAIGRVGVLTTHRRLGIATRLMNEVITDAHRRGAALSSLRASEASIYTRYGFGVAGDLAEFVIDPRRARPLTGRSVGGSFRLLEPSEILTTIEPLYDRVAHRRAGSITRPSEWIERTFRAAIERESATFVVVHHDDDGTADGYAMYTVNWTDDDDWWRRGRGEVHDLFGAGDAVEIALWRFLLDVDLVDQWKAQGRPTDDVLRDAVHDRRSVQVVGIEDEQWLRIVDVDTALARRTYQQVDGEVVLGIADPLIAQNNGRWSISHNGARPTDADADLEVDIATLSALYLGGRAWSAGVGLGTVTEVSDGAADRADALFATTLAPFCGTFF